MLFRFLHRVLASLLTFALLAPLAIAKMERHHPAYDLMVQAAERVKNAEKALYDAKRYLKLYDATNDPYKSGLIGEEYTPITTTMGSLKAKRTATNPDFAAYIVRELVDHGMGAGDSVIITMTGSFPGLNLAVLEACETLDISTLRIVSLGASSYGANQEDFTWIDMEEVLVREGLLQRHSDWVTLGGSGDVGGGLHEGVRAMLKSKAERLGYQILKSRTPKRQAAKRREILGSPGQYALLINIGGNQAMLGGAPGRELPGGWINPMAESYKDETPDEVEGIVFDFLEAGVPVLNLLHVEDICLGVGIPFDPPELPEIGLSPVYFLDGYLPPEHQEDLR